MPKFNQEAFNDLMIDNDIIGFFKKPLLLSHGRMSPWYINCRNFTEDVYLLDQLSDFIIAFIEDNNIDLDCFYGVPDGGTKTALITQYRWAKSQSNFGPGSHVLAMGRKKPKEYGEPKDRFFVGMPQGRVTVIEDVVTTGGSLIKSLEKMLELEINIVAVVVLSDRKERRDDGKSVQEKVEELGLKYYAMSNAIDLLPRAAEKLKPIPEVIESVKKYFDDYGLEKLDI